MPAPRLGITVFLSGATVMALEMAGSRVLAPFLGSSIFVWTSLIGIILTALSLGYAWGGKLADKRPEHALLSKIILLAAILTAVISLVQYPVLVMLSSLSIDLRLGAVFATVLLFAAPAVALGMVTPFAIRLSLDDIEHSGEKVGLLYALSTAGSILGTFLSGFLLIAFLGSRNLILVLGLLLLLASYFSCPKERPFIRLGFALVFGAMMVFGEYFEASLAKAGVYDIDTPYQRALVVESSAGEERVMRILMTDPLGSQSAMYPDDPAELAAEYSRFYTLAPYFKPEIRRALMLGGGAYSFPKHFLAAHPQATLDVVELDPGLTELAYKHFELKDDPRLRIFHEDARAFLNRNHQPYDVVYLDVFSSSPSVPFHLTTLEAMTRVHSLLAADGVLMANIISGLEGKTGRFFRAQHAVLNKVFAEVLVFPVAEPHDGTRVQNILLTALKKEARGYQTRPASEELSVFLKHKWEKPIAVDTPLLTDDFAPVEAYMLPVFEAMQAGRSRNTLKEAAVQR